MAGILKEFYLLLRLLQTANNKHDSPRQRYALCRVISSINDIMNSLHIIYV